MLRPTYIKPDLTLYMNRTFSRLFLEWMGKSFAGEAIEGPRRIIEIFTRYSF